MPTGRVARSDAGAIGSKGMRGREAVAETAFRFALL
jgi:hypothetical protein